MKKKLLVFFGLPLVGLMLIICLFFGVAGGGSSFIPAEEETAAEYQVIGSELSIDWTWAMLIDIFQAESSKGELTGQNPVYTALNCLKVTIDVYSLESDEDGNSDWEYDYSDYANGAEEILNYFGLPADTRDVHLVVSTIERHKSEKYRIKMEPYLELEEVLSTYYNFSEQILSQIRELNESHYLFELYGDEFSNGSGGSGILDGSVVLPAIGLKIPLYYQYQQPWQGIKFGDGTIRTSGCSITSIAMVFSYLKGSSITPDQVAAWAGYTYHSPGQGAIHTIFPAAAKRWGLNCTTLGTNMDLVVKALSEGKPVIASMSKGTFTKGGHIIVLRGIADGKILVNDPNDNAKKQHFNRSFDVSLIKREGKQFWSFK